MITIMSTKRWDTSTLRKFSHLFKKVISQLKDLFTLEEVEVTFTKVGESTRYSYTKVSHKHAA